MVVSRSYKQLMAERNAMRFMIADKEKRIGSGEKIVGSDWELKMLNQTKQQLESDKALLKEIENDIQMFRERNMGGCRQ